MTITLQEDWGEKYDIIFKLSEYMNGKLAVAMEYYDKDYEQFMPYAVLTVNLVGEICGENCAFVDTNNLGEKIIKWLVDNNLGKPTGRYGKSGFCTYPEVKFNMDEVKKYVE